MCGAWLCHSWIFGLGIELLILQYSRGLGCISECLDVPDLGRNR